MQGCQILNELSAHTITKNMSVYDKHNWLWNNKKKWNIDLPSECFNFKRKSYLDNKTSTCKQEDYEKVS